MLGDWWRPDSTVELGHHGLWRLRLATGLPGDRSNSMRRPCPASTTICPLPLIALAYQVRVTSKGLKRQDTLYRPVSSAPRK